VYIRVEKCDSEGRLITPHKNVSGVKSRDVHTVSGDYAYHHYMQVFIFCRHPISLFNMQVSIFCRLLISSIDNVLFFLFKVVNAVR